MIAVLGGGSPFTVALVDALACAAPPLAPNRLSLQGRSVDGLRRIARYAEARLGPLGWTVTHASDLQESIDGSRFIVQQIRFGGLDGRASDERAAWRFGLAADETLGPAALACVVRTATSLKDLGRTIARIAPEAWVLNLTNPLSITTALLKHEGVRHCLGICELPTTTASRVAERLGCGAGTLEWDYVGLNHRGFLVELRVEGQDVLPRFLDRLDGRDFEGSPAAVIAALNAIPTKYFRLVLQPAASGAPSRAASLSALRAQISRELDAAPDRRPPSLHQRQMEWYAVSLVPLVRALDNRAWSKHVVNEGSADGIVEEGFAHVGAGEVRPLPPPVVRNDSLNRWLDAFRAHERAVLAAAIEPSASRIHDAVEADPMIPARLHGDVAAHLSGTAAARA